MPPSEFAAQQIEQFCRDHDAVVGAPGLVYLGGEHAVLNGGLAVVQQIPRRVWVGVKWLDPTPGGQTRIELGGDNSFHVGRQAGGGELQPRDLEVAVRVAEWLCELEPYRSACGHLGRLRVRVLSEFRPNCGANFSGAFSVGVAIALHMLAESVTKPQDKKRGSGRLVLSDWGGGGRRDVWGTTEWRVLNRSQRLHIINRFAWVLETYFHGGVSSGCGTFCSLIPSRLPIVYTRQRREVGHLPVGQPLPLEVDITDWENPTPDEVSCVQRLLLSDKTGLQYRGVPVDRLFGIRVSEPRFGFGLAYSGYGKGGGSGSTKQAIMEVNSWADRLSAMSRAVLQQTSTHFGRSFLEESAELSHEVLTELASSSQAVLRFLYRPIAACSTAVLAALADLHNPRAGQHNYEALVKSIWAAHGALYQLGLIDRDARAVIAALVDAAEDGRDQIGVKYTGGGGGGYLLFVCPTGSQLDERFPRRGHHAEAIHYFSPKEPPETVAVVASIRPRVPKVTHPLTRFEWAESGWRQTETGSISETEWVELQSTSPDDMFIDARNLATPPIHFGNEPLLIEGQTSTRGRPALVVVALWLLQRSNGEGPFAEWATWAAEVSAERDFSLKTFFNWTHFKSHAVPYARTPAWIRRLSSIIGSLNTVQLRPLPGSSLSRVHVFGTLP